MALHDFLSGFQNKRLNQVVFPGSHDAGIYDKNQIGGTGLTQDMNIWQQALCGVRWFDIRIAGERVNGQIQHKAYHKALTIERKDSRTGVKFMHGIGGSGGRLDTMLQQAKDFVIANPSEFLIFKISKSQNIEILFDICRQILGDRMYCAQGAHHNLNDIRISYLAGYVVVLVSEGDAALLRKHVFETSDKGRDQDRLADLDYIFSFGELYKDKKVRPYNAQYRGLQYFGKFSGTNYFSTNAKKQSKMMEKGRSMPPTSHHAMGMMYWTLTTSPSNPLAYPVNIENRNKKLWTDRHVDKLKSIWKSGMKDAMRDHMGHLRYDQHMQIHDAVTFIPNIVMLDFANPTACATVVELNLVPVKIINELMVKRMGL